MGTHTKISTLQTHAKVATENTALIRKNCLLQLEASLSYRANSKHVQAVRLMSKVNGINKYRIATNFRGVKFSRFSLQPQKLYPQKFYTLKNFTHVTGSCKGFMKRIMALFVAWKSQPSYQILLALYQRQYRHPPLPRQTQKLEVYLKLKTRPQFLQEKRPLHKGFCRT